LEDALGGAARYVPDPDQGGGPLVGILSGLSASTSECGLVVGCDMPFLDPVVLRALIALLGDHDAVAPVVGGVVQTTHAVYRRSLDASIRTALGTGVRSPVRFLSGVRTRYVPEDELERLSPGLQSFLGVNTPEELAAAERLAQRSDSAPAPPPLCPSLDGALYPEDRP
ncbi:MAG: NTP transferase domain-containing protein, partial [Chloroflexota bacterium]